jgi:hypothetical protein
MSKFRFSGDRKRGYRDARYCKKDEYRRRDDKKK